MEFGARLLASDESSKVRLLDIRVRGRPALLLHHSHTVLSNVALLFGRLDTVRFRLLATVSVLPEVLHHLWTGEYFGRTGPDSSARTADVRYPHPLLLAAMALL